MYVTPVDVSTTRRSTWTLVSPAAKTQCAPLIAQASRTFTVTSMLEESKNQKYPESSVRPTTVPSPLEPSVFVQWVETAKRPHQQACTYEQNQREGDLHYGQHECKTLLRARTAAALLERGS